MSNHHIPDEWAEPAAYDAWLDRQNDAALEGFYRTVEGYCDYCEVEGHTFRTCPARDDDYRDYDEAPEYEDSHLEMAYEDLHG